MSQLTDHGARSTSQHKTVLLPSSSDQSFHCCVQRCAKFRTCPALLVLLVDVRSICSSVALHIRSPPYLAYGQTLMAVGMETRCKPGIDPRGCRDQYHRFTVEQSFILAAIILLHVHVRPCLCGFVALSAVPGAWKPSRQSRSRPRIGKKLMDPTVV